MDLKYTDSKQATVTVNNVLSVTTTQPATTPPPATGTKVLKITDAPYNVTPNMEPIATGKAINQCYKDAKAQKAQVEIPAGKYRCGETLKHDSITVFHNGELVHSTGECGYYMVGVNAKLIGGTLRHENQTSRGSQMWHHGIGMYDCDGFEITDVHIVNPRAAGICIWDGRNGRVTGVNIENCLADGIHHVASQDGTSGNIYNRDCTIKRAGDDCISFVTYGAGAQPVHDCEVWNFRGEDNTWGRGITILGAKNIVINGANLKRIWCFGLYVGQESGFGGAGQFSQVVMNDVKVDKCGSWTATSDTQEGLLIVGWQNTVSCVLNDCIIARPKRHGVMRYHSTSNIFNNNNTIFSEIPGQDIYNVPPPATQAVGVEAVGVQGGEPETYTYPTPFPKFEGPKRNGEGSKDGEDLKSEPRRAGESPRKGEEGHRKDEEESRRKDK